VPAVRFGSIQDQELMDIWEGAAYREFRERFAERRLGLAARAFATVSGGESTEPKMPAPPEPCRTCYKLYGA
jgi:hypothetical protein